MSAPQTGRSRWSRSARRPGEAEVVAQGSAGVIRTEDAAFLQQRDHLVGEVVQTARRDVGNEDDPSLASAWTRSLICSATLECEPTNDWRPVTSMISSRMDSFFVSASSRHCRAVSSGSRYIRTLARPLTCWRRTTSAYSLASASVSPSTYVAAGRMTSCSGVRPSRVKRRQGIGPDVVSGLRRTSSPTC